MYNRALLIFICFLSFFIQKINGQEKLLSFSLNDTTLKEIMSKIEEETDYSFVYDETVDLHQKKSISIYNKSLHHTLSSVFQNTHITWKIAGYHIVLRKEQKKISVSGYITDNQTGETLIGASIGEIGTHKGSITNNYGYYTFSTSSDAIELQASYVGYKTFRMPLHLSKDTIINIRLEASAMLQEVVIESVKNKPFTSISGAIELSHEVIKNTPTAFGEADVLKTIQLLPGVQAGVEGAAGIYVRGGGPDQNLTLLDGVNIYNPNHFYGLFSIFNGDAVKKATLYKSSFPARYGGRLSSVIDVRMNDGNMKNYHGNFSIGLLSSHFNLEGPIIKDRTSFNFSLRRSYIDAFLRTAKLFTDETVPIIYFYDLNAKINHKFSDKSRLYFSLYQGKDKMGAKMKENNYSEKTVDEVSGEWGNTIGSLRWNYVFNNKLFTNVTAAYNNYKYDFKSSFLLESRNENESGNSYFLKNSSYQYTGIEDWSTNIDFEYIPDKNHDIRFGAGYIYHTFKPEIHGVKTYEEKNGDISSNIDKPFLSEEIKAHETSIYIEDEISLGDKLKTNIGGHFSMFHVQDKTYLSLQPRLSIGFEMNRNLSFKSSYSEMNQYIHLLTSSSLSNPTDIWVPTTSDLKPMFSRQVTLGAFYDTRTGYNFSIEGFYKTMDRLLEYKDGSLWASPLVPWYEQVESGKGKSYGVEFFAQKSIGKFSGWFGYTLAWNKRKFPTINQGREYYAKYDHRHDVKINSTYRINEKWDLNASWVFGSGNNMTLPLEEYISVPSGELNYNWYGNNSHVWIEKYTERNNYRMKPTHHLDLSINYYRKKSDKGRQAIWNFTIYNVYNQSCPYIVYPNSNPKNGKRTLTQVSLLPILPSVTYTYKF